MTQKDLIEKWESTARYYRRCCRQTSDRDAELICEAKAEVAESIVEDLKRMPGQTFPHDAEIP